MDKRTCDQCGMPEDHYGTNTMPLHRVIIDRHTSATVCDDCAATAMNNGDLTPSQIANIPGLKERRGKL